MTRDEKAILLRMITGEISGGIVDYGRARSRLIAGGYIKVGRTRGHPWHGRRHNSYALTQKGSAVAVRLASEAPPILRPRLPRASLLRERLDAYGCRIYRGQP